jgi:hypothetical protein
MITRVLHTSREPPSWLAQQNPESGRGLDHTHLYTGTGSSVVRVSKGKANDNDNEPSGQKSI